MIGESWSEKGFVSPEISFMQGTGKLCMSLRLGNL